MGQSFCQQWEQIEPLLTAQAYEQVLEKTQTIRMDRLTEQDKQKITEAFDQIPPELKKKSMQHCLQEIGLAYQKGDFFAVEQWFNALLMQREGKREGTPARATLENMITCAGIYREKADNAALLLSFSLLYNEIPSPQKPFYNIGVTGKRPSVLNGGRDLSEWGKNYRAVSSIVRPMLGTVMEEGECAVATAVAELLYEKNMLNDAAIQIAGALSADDPDLTFAGFSVLSKICRVDSTAKKPVQVLDKIESLLREKKADWLWPNFKALQARDAIFTGNLEQVRQWISESGLDELDACTPDNYYRMATLAKAFLAVGKYREALTLLSGQLLKLRADTRPLDMLDCLADSAVACEMMGSTSLALDRLDSALKLAVPYGYIRVFADKGKPLLHLLLRYQEAFAPAGSLKRLLEEIIASAKTFSSLCPALYEPPQAQEEEAVKDLTPMELEVLNLLKQGNTNQQIAAALHIQVTTIKFHLRNLFQKFEVTNRTELVAILKQKKQL